MAGPGQHDGARARLRRGREKKWDGSGGQAEQALGRSRGGFTVKVHGGFSSLGPPVELQATAGQESDIRQASALLADHQPVAVIADKGSDSDAFRAAVAARGAEAVIPPLACRKQPPEYDRHLYRERNVAERFWSKVKQFRRVATRYDKKACNYLAFLQVAAIWGFSLTRPSLYLTALVRKDILDRRRIFFGRFPNATGAVIMASEFDPSEAAKALGRRGGIKGGKARAAKLSSEERSEIARRAVEARWAKARGERADQPPEILRTLCGSDDRPLRIGGIEIPCYVLEDERRVLVQRSMVKALGMSRGSSSVSGGDRLAKFASGKALEPFVGSTLRAVTEPIKFLMPKGQLAYGYEATILAELCEAVLAARRAGVLQKQQLHIADRCEILVRGFARVGIIALVDEATGYQRIRERDELAKILEAFVAKEIQQWLKTFDMEFYELICELRGEPLDRAKKRPKYFGRLTNNLVYQRLAPGVLQKLQEVNPVTETGRRKHAHHQHLTPDLGHPKLREHLSGVTSVMRFAKQLGMKWKEFLGNLDKTHPKYQPMPLFDRQEDDD